MRGQSLGLMVAGIALRALAELVHAYPTQGTAIRLAADGYVRMRLSPLMLGLARRWLRREPGRVNTG